MVAGWVLAVCCMVHSGALLSADGSIAALVLGHLWLAVMVE